jgi:two-component system sensor histidine kinase DesK
LRSRPAAHVIVPLGLAVAAFVALYLVVMLSSNSHSAWLILGMAAIACAVILPSRTAWTALIVYCAVAAGFRLPQPYSRWAVVACALLAVGTAVLAGGDAESAAVIAVTTLAVGFMILALASLVQVNVELREAREQLAVMAVAEERLRFARDLHDLLGHSLSVIALKGELARRVLAENPEEAGRDIDDMTEVARSALREVRETVSGYREPTLAAEIAGARFALSAAGIKSTITEGTGTLPAEADPVLAWAVREGTTNIIRHSGAHSCRISLERTAGSASVEITDDGRGGNADGPGHGLQGLRERAQTAGGWVEAGSAQQGGFRLLVTVPLSKE